MDTTQQHTDAKQEAAYWKDKYVAITDGTKKEQSYWRDKWKESNNVVVVMQLLQQTQAVQIAELKTKLRRTLASLERVKGHKTHTRK